MLATDVAVVASVGVASTVDVVEQEYVAPMPASATRRWWKLEILNEPPSTLQATVGGVVVYKCLPHNCAVGPVDISGAKGELVITWGGAATGVRVHEYTRRSVVLESTPTWWTAWEQSKAEQWALQGLLRAGEGVFRQPTVFSEAECTACVAGLVCKRHV